MNTSQMPGNDVPDGNCEPAWFAVQVRGGREHYSASHLKARGYEVFLPSYWELHRWSDRVKKVERALFTGYLFCKALVESTAKIVTAPGVIRIVGDRRRLLPVPSWEVENLQRVVASRLERQPWPSVGVGQTVDIKEGPLRGTSGSVIHIKDRSHLIVSVSILQRSVAVEVRREWIRAGYGSDAGILP